MHIVCVCVAYAVNISVINWHVLFVQLREQLFEQEKKLLQSQNEWLNSELDSKSEILLKLQKDRVSESFLSTPSILLFINGNMMKYLCLMPTLGTTGLSVREWIIEAEGGGETADISAGDSKKKQIRHWRETWRIESHC